MRKALTVKHLLRFALGVKFLFQDNLDDMEVIEKRTEEIKKKKKYNKINFSRELRRITPCSATLDVRKRQFVEKISRNKYTL